VCAPSAAAASPADERLAALGADVGAFADFADGLRTSGLRHVAMYAPAVGSLAGAGVDAKCAADGEEKRRRSLLGIFGAEAEAPAPLPAYVCDDLCVLQTNIVSGLIFFWVVVMCILFGQGLTLVHRSAFFNLRHPLCGVLLLRLHTTHPTNTTNGAYATLQCGHNSSHKKCLR